MNRALYASPFKFPYEGDQPSNHDAMIQSHCRSPVMQQWRDAGIGTVAVNTVYGTVHTASRTRTVWTTIAYYTATAIDRQGSPYGRKHTAAYGQRTAINPSNNQPLQITIGSIRISTQGTFGGQLFCPQNFSSRQTVLNELGSAPASLANGRECSGVEQQVMYDFKLLRDCYFLKLLVHIGDGAGTQPMLFFAQALQFCGHLSESALVLVEFGYTRITLAIHDSGKGSQYSTEKKATPRVTSGTRAYFTM
ncbi:hypothetical protein C8R47DRAFT_1083894 [Mycena vitilis]|nr:hypothetical protein C8R47DRAFT_1083894 [Mycena vitilis]